MDSVSLQNRVFEICQALQGRSTTETWEVTVPHSWVVTQVLLCTDDANNCDVRGLHDVGVTLEVVQQRASSRLHLTDDDGVRQVLPESC